MNDEVVAFVSGYGTGGTLAGCARALRRANPSVKIVAMEPFESALLSGEEACCHWIEGIAGGFVPPLLREVSIDQVIKVSSSDAMQMARRLNREYGLLVGSSSGANVMAALQVAATLPADSKVVTIYVTVPSVTLVQGCLRSCIFILRACGRLFITRRVTGC